MTMQQKIGCAFFNVHKLVFGSFRYLPQAVSLVPVVTDAGIVLNDGRVSSVVVTLRTTDTTMYFVVRSTDLSFASVLILPEQPSSRSLPKLTVVSAAST